MANMVFAADVLFPEYHEGDDLDKVVKAICDYLFLWREGLGYTLDNLGVKNINSEQLNVIGDLIRKPVDAQLSELSVTVDAMGNDYVSLTRQDQASSTFNLTIKDGNDNDVLSMDSAGLTGTIYDSSIYGSELYTCDDDRITDQAHIYIGTQNGSPVIQSYDNNANVYGFRAIGDSIAPYFGLYAEDNYTIVDFRTYYNSTTGNVITRIEGSHAFMGWQAQQVGIAYVDDGISKTYWLNVNDTGVHISGDALGTNGIVANETGVFLTGNVYINGVLQ